MKILCSNKVVGKITCLTGVLSLFNSVIIFVVGVIGVCIYNLLVFNLIIVICMFMFIFNFNSIFCFCSKNYICFGSISYLYVCCVNVGMSGNSGGGVMRYCFFLFLFDFFVFCVIVVWLFWSVCALLLSSRALSSSCFRNVVVVFNVVFVSFNVVFVVVGDVGNVFSVFGIIVCVCDDCCCVLMYFV